MLIWLSKTLEPGNFIAPPICTCPHHDRLQLYECAAGEKATRHSAETGQPRRGQLPTVSMQRPEAVQILQVSVSFARSCSACRCTAQQTHEVLKVNVMLLQAAEAGAASSGGAHMLWGDKRTVPAALQLLAVPAAGPQQMNFKDPEFQRALKVCMQQSCRLTFYRRDSTALDGTLVLTPAAVAIRPCRCPSTCCGMASVARRACPCSWAWQRPSGRRPPHPLPPPWLRRTLCGTRRATWRRRWQSTTAPAPTGAPWSDVAQANAAPHACEICRCVPSGVTAAPGSDSTAARCLCSRFISLEESPRLYAGLLATRQGPDPWSVVAAAADGMAGILRRAQVK